MAGRAFFLDDHVFNGYVDEVRRRADDFTDAWGDIAPVRFAVAAWRIATVIPGPAPRGRLARRRAHMSGLPARLASLALAHCAGKPDGRFPPRLA